MDRHGSDGQMRMLRSYEILNGHVSITNDDANVSADEVLPTLRQQAPAPTAVIQQFSSDSLRSFSSRYQNVGTRSYAADVEKTIRSRNSNLIPVTPSRPPILEVKFQHRGEQKWKKSRSPRIISGNKSHKVRVIKQIFNFTLSSSGKRRQIHRFAYSAVCLV